MSNVLQDAGNHDNITEVYEVVQTAEVVIDGKNRFRLDVTKSYNPTEGGIDIHYSVTCWKYESYHLQPSYPMSEEASKVAFGRSPEEERILVPGDMPWLHESTADGALRRAISYLATGQI